MNTEEKVKFAQDYINQHNLSEVYSLKKNLLGQWKVYTYHDCMKKYSNKMPIDKFIERIQDAENDVMHIDGKKFETQKTLVDINTGNGISSYLKYKNKQSADKAKEKKINKIVKKNKTFGVAIEAMKRGKKVAREGWNGKNMFLWLKPAARIKSEWCKDPMLKGLADTNGGELDALGTICMLTAQKQVLTGWLASQTDMLSDDWMILD